MIYNPPFTVTPKIIDLISAISEQVGFVQRDFLNPAPQLRRANRIKTITGTLQIEGNTLGEDQVSAIFDGKTVLASVRELSEVKGAIAAYDKLSVFNPYRVDDLLEAHRLMMGEVLSGAGRFRNKAVGVCRGKDVVHIAPPAERVAGLVSDLLAWAKGLDAHPLVVGSVFHYEFEFIHPFMDGNGRMGRFWQTLMLSRWKSLFADIPLESVIKQSQQDYYQALRRADSDADSTVFIRFMLEAILKTLKNASANVSLNAPVNIKDMKTPDAIMALVAINPKMTRAEMAEQIGKDIRTIGRAIKKLQEEGLLRRVGSDKSGYWKLLIPGL